MNLPQTNRTIFFSDFVLRHVAAFRVHRRHRGTLGQANRDWRNVAEHCLAAGVFSEHIAEQLSLDDESILYVTHAAILHDCFKRDEVETVRVADDSSRPAHWRVAAVRAAVDSVRNESLKVMQEFGVSDKVLALTGANLLSDPDGPQDDQSKIMFFVDQILQGTEVVAHAERLSAYDNPDRFDGLWSESFRDEFNGMSLGEAEQLVMERISQEFSERLGHTGPADELPFALETNIHRKATEYKPNDIKP